MPKSIMILGDLIIDETWQVEVTRLNPEAPTPTAELLGHRPLKTPGGAGFAAAWAASQGMEVHFLTAASPLNTDNLKKYGVKVYSLQEDYNLNVKKIRYIECKSGYHLLRLDNDRLVERPNVSPEDVLATMERIGKGNRIDVCLLSDYVKGFFLSTAPWNKVFDWLEERKIPTLLDTRAKDIRFWLGNSTKHVWIKLNDRELAIAARAINAGGVLPYNLIVERYVSNLIVTHGAIGAHAYQFIPPDAIGTSEVKPTAAYDVVADPTGCGDILDVSFLSALEDGKSIQETLQYAVDTATKFAYIRLGEKLNG